MANILDLSKIQLTTDIINIQNYILDIDHSKIELFSVCNQNIKLITNLDILQNLKYVDVSHNKLDTLPNLPQSVIEIICSDNQITKLKLDYPNLKRLDCSNNRIKKISCNSLQILTSSNNPIEKIICPNITKLFAENNNIRGGDFKNLIIADFTNNNLSTIDFLNQAICLEQLFLNNNFLQKIDPNFINLKVLHIYKNPIKEIPFFKQLLSLHINNSHVRISKLYTVVDYNAYNNIMCLEFK